MKINLSTMKKNVLFLLLAQRYGSEGLSGTVGPVGGDAAKM